MDFRLESGEKARLAELLVGFGPGYEGSGGAAGFAELGGGDGECRGHGSLCV